MNFSSAKIFLNGFLFQGTYHFTVNYKLDFSCQPVDYTTTGYGNFQLYFNYYYFCFKLLDLVDTVSVLVMFSDVNLIELLIYTIFSGFHHSEEEKQSVVAAASLPPHCSANGNLHVPEIRGRWCWGIPRIFEQPGPCFHVFL